MDRKLKERYPDVKILRMNSFGTPIDPPEKAYEIAEQCDAWLEGVKDAHAQGRHDAGVCMERAGRPGVSISVDVLRRAKNCGCENGNFQFKSPAEDERFSKKGR